MGTTFKIYLPRATGLQQTPAEASVSSNVEGGHETILVVEDDTLVRRYVMTQIEPGLRYAGGLQRVRCLAHHRRCPHRRPAFHRRDHARRHEPLRTVDEALKRRPGLKTLYTSGYTENAIVQHGRLDSGVLLLANLPQIRTCQDHPAGACQLSNGRG